MTDFHSVFMTADCVVFTKVQAIDHVLLIQRKNPPYQNKWALPGGFLDANETIDVCARRELAEETGLQVTSLDLVGVYSEPQRDPRSRVVTVAFWTEVAPSLMKEAVAQDDAKDIKWLPLSELRAEELAFDHWTIVQQACAHRENR